MEKNMKHYNIEQDMRYLQLLSQSFPTIAEASTEIINLQAILNLPKGTEHFLADIHGEYVVATRFEHLHLDNLVRPEEGNAPEISYYFFVYVLPLDF